MNFLTFFLYYLAVDAILSLTVFGVLYLRRHHILLNLRLKANQFIDKRIQFNQDVDAALEEDDTEELKPAMKAALDEEFGLDG